jgi:hypothetical protein
MHAEFIGPCLKDHNSHSILLDTSLGYIILFVRFPGSSFSLWMHAEFTSPCLKDYHSYSILLDNSIGYIILFVWFHGSSFSLWMYAEFFDPFFKDPPNSFSCLIHLDTSISLHV